MPSMTLIAQILRTISKKRSFPILLSLGVLDLDFENRVPGAKKLKDFTNLQPTCAAHYIKVHNPASLMYNNVLRTIGQDCTSPCLLTVS